MHLTPACGKSHAQSRMLRQIAATSSGRLARSRHTCGLHRLNVQRQNFATDATASSHPQSTGGRVPGSFAKRLHRQTYTLNDLDGNPHHVEMLLVGSTGTHSAEQNAPELWSVVWPSAVALATELVRQPEWVAEHEVLELGCGLGLSGLTAALCGASRVVLTDVETLAVRTALASATMNNLDVAKDSEQQPLLAEQIYGHIIAAERGGHGFHCSGLPAENTEMSSCEISGSTVDFTDPVVSGNPASLAAACGLCPRVQASRSGVVDVVIIADVLYEDQAVDGLAAAISALLRPGGRLILADPAGRVPGLNAGQTVEGRAKELLRCLAGPQHALRLKLEAVKCVEVSGSLVGLQQSSTRAENLDPEADAQLVDADSSIGGAQVDVMVLTIG